MIVQVKLNSSAKKTRNSLKSLKAKHEAKGRVYVQKPMFAPRGQHTII